MRPCVFHGACLPAIACGLMLAACAAPPAESQAPAAAASQAQTRVTGQPQRLFSALDLGLLETPDRDRWQRVDEILDNLKIAEGAVVADIAAGGGWLSVRIARRVGPTGIVYAEEIQPTMIQAIAHRVQMEDLANVRPVLGTPIDPRLPRGTVDVAIIANAFHDIDAPVPLLESLRGALNRRGRIGVIEFTMGAGGPGPDQQERVRPETIIAAAEAAHLRLLERYPVPPFEYLLVFGQ